MSGNPRDLLPPDVPFTVTLVSLQPPAVPPRLDRPDRVAMPAPAIAPAMVQAEIPRPAAPDGPEAALSGREVVVVPLPPQDQPDIGAGLSVQAADTGAADHWERAVLESLERRKRYPPRARSEGLWDTVYMYIRVDRTGRVISSNIDRSRGIALLDRAALALVQRASPLPAPPASLHDSALEFVVPLDYSIEGAGR